MEGVTLLRAPYPSTAPLVLVWRTQCLLASPCQDEAMISALEIPYISILLAETGAFGASCLQLSLPRAPRPWWNLWDPQNQNSDAEEIKEKTSRQGLEELSYETIW